jgi:hypothetical protein
MKRSVISASAHRLSCALRQEDIMAKGQVRSTKEKRKPKKEKPKPGTTVFGDSKGKAG